jgi:hypothetical protein
MPEPQTAAASGAEEAPTGEPAGDYSLADALGALTEERAQQHNQEVTAEASKPVDGTPQPEAARPVEAPAQDLSAVLDASKPTGEAPVAETPPEPETPAEVSRREHAAQAKAAEAEQKAKASYEEGLAKGRQEAEAERARANAAEAREPRCRVHQAGGSSDRPSLGLRRAGQ